MNTVAIFRGVPLDRNYTQSIDFANATEQYQFFGTYYEGVYLESDRPIKLQDGYVRINGEELERWENYRYFNYLIMTLDNGERVYAFIDNIEYIAKQTAQINYTIDYFQTYMFNYQLDDCFIEREHLDRFEFIPTGESGFTYKEKIHPISEGLEVGDFLELKTTAKLKPTGVTYNNFPSGAYVVTMYIVTEQLVNYESYLNIETPFTIYLCPILVNINSAGQEVLSNNRFRFVVGGTETYLQPYKTFYDEFKKDAKTYNIFIAPLPPDNHIYTYNQDGTVTMTRTAGAMQNIIVKTHERENPILYVNNFPVSNYTQIKTINSFDTFTSDANPFDVNAVKNINNETKLKHADFLKMLVKQGKNLVNCDYQLLRDDVIGKKKNFTMYHSFSASPAYNEFVTVDSITSNTRGYFNGKNELPLSTEAYLNYITQSKASSIAGIAVPLATTALGIGATAIGGGGVGVPMIVGGIASTGANIANEMAKRKDLQAQPDNLRGIDDISLNLATFNFQWRLHIYEISETFKRNVFEYLYRYGYRSNRIGKPELRSRWRFNYIKLGGVTFRHLHTAINQDIQEQITNIYLRGITIWHKRANLAYNDYFIYDKENMETVRYELGS